MEFRVLGPLSVISDGVAARLGGPRPRALLAVLLVHTDRSVSRERLIEQLWGERPPATATSAIQVHLSALRKVLGDRLVTSPSGYLLRAGRHEVDALRFEDLITAARTRLTGAPGTAAADLTAALALWHGEPYGGVPAGSDVTAERLRLVELRLSALEDRLDAELTLGRHAAVVSELAGLVVDHPTRERLAGLHLLALHRCGRTAEAQVAYRQLVERLRDELGVAPSAELDALARAIDRGDPTIDRPSVVPAPASRFIGRRRELEDLAARLGETRLLTVTGPGGAGKTRIALELARDTVADHPDGVHVVELAPAPAGSSIVDWAAATVSVWPGATESLMDALVTRLRGSRSLLVLDNCEHVVESAAAVSAELLSRCAGLRIVATSREPLGVPGELVWPLSGLAVPGEGDAGAAAAASEAVRLLADRGAAARPGFTVDAGNVAVAATLCQHLDGLPLAIELAAAQLRVLSLDEVAERLDQRLELADARARTVPDRHRTMRAAIDRSYQLLNPGEQTLFARLAVFTGGFGRRAAERVADAAPEVLDRLVDQSMLVAEPRADGTRYHMLELIGEYAAERLAESGELAELRRRHAAWCTTLAAEHTSYGGPDHNEALRRLGVEEANLRAALNWCTGEGADPARALEIAHPIWWYWWTRGLMVEGRAWLTKGLAGIDAAPSVLRGAALRAAASLTRNSGDYAAARALGEESLAVYRSLVDEPGVGAALMGLCVTALAQCDFTAALRFGTACRDTAEQLGNRRLCGSALNSSGIALRSLGRREQAVEWFTSALGIFEELGDRRGCGAAQGNLGFSAWQAGSLREARRHYLRSVAYYRDIDLVEGQLDGLEVLAGIEIAEGRAESGLRLLTVAERERLRLGCPLIIQDELAARDSALAAAHAVLGARAAAVTEAARDVPLAEVVSGLLA